MTAGDAGAVGAKKIVPLSRDLVLRACVFGPPMTYGSKRPFVVHPKGGGKPKAVLANVNHKNLREWQDALRERMRAVAPPEPILEAVTVTVTFFLSRPQGHFRTIGGRASNELKPSAPLYPTRRPDGDKVARAAWDCMAGIWVRNDAQVSDAIIRKRWAEAGESERTEVELRTMR